MKKLLVLVTVMVAVFGFSTGAFAAWGDPICTNCKCPDIGHVSCEIDSGQGETPACYHFDYDDQILPRTGYCSEDSFGGELNCRAIFNICNCENPEVFKSDETIGIRMTILVDNVPGENGAYWSAPATAEIELEQYASEKAACAATAQVDSFGLGKFYKYGCVTEVMALTGNTDCIVPSDNQATVILSDGGYIITEDNVTNKESHWWIDIPEMRIDPNVLHNGELISVKIELLAEGSGGICADCTSVCECIINVAYVCCNDILMPEKFGMYFPYVISLNAWSTGIVVTNISNILPVEFGMNVLPADMEVTLVLHDVNGDVFTLFKDDFTTTSWSFGLAGLLPDFDGVPADGPAWLEVQTNFAVDGYSYINNGLYGLGTLPRQWSTLIELYKQYAPLFDLNPFAYPNNK
ncbi:MAG: hypothetical protein U9N38_07210 [Thermodesulfobacteriota bacterium]|nr:hypothetical protein [Thermodesulfobacteriota bacterium]